MPTFTERLNTASVATHSLLCVGLDPDPKRMPVADAAAFNRAIVSATADLVCAYKPNLAFYEALGMPGLRALEATIAHIRQTAPHCVIIGDCKRGDIGNSAAAYVTAMFDVWDFDAVTINPWGGFDTVEHWLSDPERGAFVWCHSSNPGAADLQEHTNSDAEPAYLRLARQLQPATARGNLGLVVGATAPEHLIAVRQICPNAPLLIPGIGAHGGNLPASVRNGVDAQGRSAIISATRIIIYASSGKDYANAARRQAMAIRNAINETLDKTVLGWQQPNHPTVE